MVLWESAIQGAVLSAWALLLAVPAHAQETACLGGVADALQTLEHDRSVDLCPEESGPWLIQLHDGIGKQGFLTNGSALNLFHLPQPDAAAAAGVVLSVVLSPLSDSVWSVGFVPQGELTEQPNPHTHYVWAPGNNARGPAVQPDIDWGQDEPRFFRCLTYQGFRCITYYAVAPCPVSEAEDDGWSALVLSVRRDVEAEGPGILDGYGEIDALAHRLAAEVSRHRC